MFNTHFFLNESSHCAIIECFSSKRISGTVLIFFSYDLAVLVALGLLCEGKKQNSKQYVCGMPKERTNQWWQQTHKTDYIPI
jgi:hypothetical protein